MALRWLCAGVVGHRHDHALRHALVFWNRLRGRASDEVRQSHPHLSPERNQRTASLHSVMYGHAGMFLTLMIVLILQGSVVPYFQGTCDRL